MADKRIHELSDTQAAYSPDIFIQVDDITFSNTRKMPVDAVYSKTNTLTAVGNYNPTTLLLRTDNGSGSENKVTVTNLLSDSDTVTLLKSLLALSSSALSFQDISPANVTLTQLSGNKFSKVQFITGRITVTSTTGAEYNIADITGYQSPGFDVWFPLSASVNTNENAYGKITTTGRLSMLFFNDGTWNFNTTVIGS